MSRIKDKFNRHRLAPEDGYLSCELWICVGKSEANIRLQTGTFDVSVHYTGIIARSR